jgi:hypothetical protein
VDDLQTSYNEGFDTEAEAVEGEIVEEPPREGTLAWLQLQPTVEVEGLGLIPACHRLNLDAGAIYLGEDDGRCRYIRPEVGRCGATRMRAYGLCPRHAGGGPTDMHALAKRGAATQARLRLSRKLLGVGTVRGADPRQIARVRAHARSEEIADALLAPLDDDQLSALAQQRSAVTILDALYPQQTVQVTVEMPADEAGVQALGWQEMQTLAAQLLGDTSETEALDPA